MVLTKYEYQVVVLVSKEISPEVGGESYSFTFHVCRNQCSALKLQLTTGVGSFKQGFFIDERQMFDKSLRDAIFLGIVERMNLHKDRIGMPPTWVRLTQGILLRPV